MIELFEIYIFIFNFFSNKLMTAAETTHTGDIESVTVQFTPSATSTNANLQCRMYAGRFPEVDSIVMVNVQQIAEIGAYVSLLEYNGIEGMIQLSEFSRRRIRSLQKLGPYLFNAVRVGRNEVVVVMRVDAEKGYIDLSKRRASPEDVLSCEERYLKSKAVKSALSRFCDKITKVHSIMRQCAEVLGENLESLYERFGWPLYKTYGHALDAFKIGILILNQPLPSQIVSFQTLICLLGYKRSSLNISASD